MADPDFDQLLKTYRIAVDNWIDRIRAEESLATEDHSISQMELWDDARFKVNEAAQAAEGAREAYQNALRERNYGI